MSILSLYSGVTIESMKPGSILVYKKETYKLKEYVSILNNVYLLKDFLESLSIKKFSDFKDPSLIDGVVIAQDLSNKTLIPGSEKIIPVVDFSNETHLDDFLLKCNYLKGHFATKFIKDPSSVSLYDTISLGFPYIYGKTYHGRVRKLKVQGFSMLLDKVVAMIENIGIVIIENKSIITKEDKKNSIVLAATPYHFVDTYNDVKMQILEDTIKRNSTEIACTANRIKSLQRDIEVYETLLSTLTKNQAKLEAELDTYKGTIVPNPILSELKEEFKILLKI